MATGDTKRIGAQRLGARTSGWPPEPPGIGLEGTLSEGLSAIPVFWQGAGGGKLDAAQESHEWEEMVG